MEKAVHTGYVKMFLYLQLACFITKDTEIFIQIYKLIYHEVITKYVKINTNIIFVHVVFDISFIRI
jgi:hypothetical protein